MKCCNTCEHYSMGYCDYGTWATNPNEEIKDICYARANGADIEYKELTWDGVRKHYVPKLDLANMMETLLQCSIGECDKCVFGHDPDDPFGDTSTLCKYEEVYNGTRL